MGRWVRGAAIAVGAAALVAPPAATAGVIFGGVTSQREPIVVEVSPGRAKVTEVRWEWRARCTLGPAAPAGTPTTTAWSDTAGPYPIDRLGRWRGNFSAGPFVKDAATGITETFTYRLNGTLVQGGTRMRGTFRATYTESSPAGAIRTCASGTTYVIKD
jgi:hypothetical protein